MSSDFESRGSTAGPAPSAVAAPSAVDGTFEAAVESYLSRVEAGERPSIDEYLTAYPSSAEELRRFFDDLEFLNHTFDGAAPIVVDQSDFAEPSELDADTGEGVIRVKGFRILKEIGGGSQGVVYKAEQISTGRLVALKVIRGGPLSSAAERIRFDNEVRLASRLQHPSIVAIYESGQSEGHRYFAMEFVEGRPLDEYCDSEALSTREIVALFEKVCRGVAYAHQRGVIHRDLKPTNILVDGGGEPHLLDSGLARLVDGGSEHSRQVTTVGDFAGTWFYASPEQVRRDPTLIDVRTDVYALGVILYELVTGCFPYPVEDETRDSLTRHILNTPPLPPRAVNREVECDLETILLRSLSKERERRYQSASALADDLEHFLRGEVIDARRDSALYVAGRLARQYRWAVGAGATALIVLLTFSVVITYMYGQAKTAEATIEARMDLVRGTQRFLVEELSNYQRLDNHLQAEREAGAASGSIRHFAKPVDTGLADTFRELSASMPPAPDGVAVMDSRNSPELREWVKREGEALSSLSARLRRSRYEFSIVRFGLNEAIRDNLPSDDRLPQFVAAAFLARAILAFDAGHDEAATSSLDAAGSIGLSLFDGSDVSSKGAGLAVRIALYRTLLIVLSSRRWESESPSAYQIWLSADAPIGRYGLLMINERVGASQFIEAAIVARPGKKTTYIDYDRLDRFADGLATLYGFGAQNRVESFSVSASRTVMDRFVQSAATWDELSLPELRSASRTLSDSLRSTPEWERVRYFFWRPTEGFELRLRCVALRSVAHLVGHLVEHLASTGRWPDSIEEAVPAHARHHLRDAVSGKPFMYRLESDGPKLYRFAVPDEECVSSAETVSSLEQVYPLVDGSASFQGTEPRP